MALPAPRDTEALGMAVSAIQRARRSPLSIFTDEEDDSGQQFREYRDVEVLNLYFERDKVTWRKLHNDPNVEIISESEKSNKIATLTYIKFIRRVPVDEPDPEPDTFAEPCEEGDPLVDEMWPE